MQVDHVYIVYRDVQWLECVFLHVDTNGAYLFQIRNRFVHLKKVPYLEQPFYRYLSPTGLTFRETTDSYYCKVIARCCLRGIADLEAHLRKYV